MPHPHRALNPSALGLGGLALVALSACAGDDVAYTGQAPDAEPGRLVVDLIDGTSLAEARQATGLPLEWVSDLSADEALAVVDVNDIAAEVDRLDDLSLVEAVEGSLEVQAFGWPDDPMYDKQWNFEIVGAKTGWRAGAGRGVTVAVIDTGVTRVADLNETTILKGATFVPGTKTADDDNGHGTHVAGTVAQSTNNALGVAGIAYAADILPIKVLSGRGFGRSEWVASGIDEAVDQGAEVINLSLGGGNSSVIANAVKKAVDAGVIVVAAAGNSGRRGVGCPANVPGVIAVSATGPDDTLAFYSSYGKEVVISAPGGDKRKPGGGVLQDTIDKKAPDGHAFKEFQGTSMATPHVAGAAAVLLSAGAGSADQVKDILIESSNDLGSPGHDEKYGHGRLDIAAAVRQLALNEHGLMFALAALSALGLAALGRLRKDHIKMAATAGLVSGGAFFLPLLPILPTPTLEIIAAPFLNWPGLTFSDAWAANPLWLSALIPLVLTFFLAPVRWLGPLISGFSVGVGVHLLHGAFTGSLDVLWMSGFTGSAWLAVNGLLAMLCALAGVGLNNYQDRKLNGEL
ncbi:MAG: S8 family serine peptidase [Myxococcota bacterium]